MPFEVRVIEYGGSPWIVYGQTEIPVNSSVSNPTPNTNGLVGEVATLPYLVPDGHRLVLTGWGIEGNRDPFSVLFPWIGEPPATNAKALMSAGSMAGMGVFTGVRFVVPAGKKVNVHLINGSAYPMVHGWFVQGELVMLTP